MLKALFAVGGLFTTLASATYGDMITPDGRTDTTVLQQGSVYNVYSGTVRGDVGFNSFSTFDVYAGTTANLHLADGTGKLINVVRDSASHIDGVLNSYRNGSIGGDVFFLNPNGIFVGKTGVVNVGRITMSRPTAAFVEQLIARDGSIASTATQAVLAGDMPINPEGTISIKGKVNARHNVEMRAGKVDVKGGEINTGVKFGDMVNTGKRKVDTKGTRIEGGKLSFGKKPQKAQRPAKATRSKKRAKQADIAIFADAVSMDGAVLNADSVYIDPDKLELSNIAVSGDYTLEARVITLRNITVRDGKALTGFTLNAANELADGTFAGEVSITLADSNILAGTVSINATATTTGADAVITISGSTLSADGSISLEAQAVQGDATVTLGADASARADMVTLSAATETGNAKVYVRGSIQGGNAVTLAAATAQGTYGDADIILDGKVSSLYTETKSVGDLGLERTEAETMLETDTEETANAKNAAYLARYAEYLSKLDTGTAATATMDITAVSLAGNSTITQGAQSDLRASLSATIAAEAYGKAEVQLAGRLESGTVSAAATGETAQLLVAEDAAVAARAHRSFVQEGTTVSVQENSGALSLAAKSREDQDPENHAPAKKDGVLLEVAGSLGARREESDGEGTGGSISLASDGKLTITETAGLDAFDLDA